MNAINYISHKNAPTATLLIITQETEKAYKVKNYELSEYMQYEQETWIPKSAFEDVVFTAVNGVKTEYKTLKSWFRKSLTENNNNVAKKILGLMSL